MLFDLDGTLWHFDEVPSPETIAQALAPRIKAVVAGWGERSLTPYADLDLALFGAQTEALREAEAGDLREPDLDRVFIGELGRHDIRADAPQSRELRLAMWPDPAIVGQRMIEGAVETLHLLHSAGTKLAVVTNRSVGGSVLRRELAYHGVDSLFDTVLAAEDVGWRKPHPAIVERALADLGVRADRAAMVGDAPVEDIQAAVAAGVASILMRRKGVARVPFVAGQTRPDYEASSFQELAEMLGMASRR